MVQTLIEVRHYIAAILAGAAVLLMLAACASEPAGSAGMGRQVAAFSSATATVTDTPVATYTPVPTLTFTPTPGPSATPSNTPTRTPVPTYTPSATATPTSRPQSSNILPSFGTPESLITATPSTPIPTAVPEFQVSDDVTNVLLLGSDKSLEDGVSRTDTIIIVSVNRETETASMVSLPRDMYVYIPGWTMNRINTAMAHGASSGYPTGAVGQLKDTILYNFGVPIHYFARIDFEGFKTVVDAMGGVDIAVSCPLEDWRLKSPELEPQDEDNWERFRLEPGVHHMDGDLALWYARSRLSSSDFDRGRRQQQLLRAMLNQGVELNMLPQVPTLYEAYRDTVETDLDIGRILQLATLAPTVAENGVQHLYIVGDQLEPWVEPRSGAHVQLPQWDKMENTFYRLFQPPALNSGARPPIYVEVINGTENPDLAQLAADNLEWYGFEPVIGTADRRDYENTTISYYADNFKSSYDWLISWIFGKSRSQIELVPDTPYDYDYRVVLGADYDPCVNRLFAPREFLN